MPSSATITFKTFSTRWFAIIFLTLTGSLLLLFFCLIDFYTLRISVIFSSIIIIGSYFTSYLLVRGYTEISVHEDEFLITTNFKLIRKSENHVLLINECRGYEIRETQKAQTDLMLYKKDFEIFRYPINKLEERHKIDLFLFAHLSKLTALNNPKYKTYGHALWFAIKRAGLLLFTTFLLLAGLIAINSFSHFPPFFLVGAVLVYSIPLWWYIVKEPLKKAYFRFNAFSAVTSMFIFFSWGLFFH